MLALPKLNLQFLTFHDYLLRNFNLFRCVRACLELFCRELRHCMMLLCYRGLGPSP